ncbi:PiggyBac transposable element-derived protein 4 [Geodia barretti]|uniref:PiggyBac transposable element-derived protein 4 n=1 Tax=Geodia barretti TaxID=519541 RepID=A0AA35T4J6_GEOBA|nr:PiggyBac transposable element-derived protein 4 [Geodia barretti]
MIGFKGRLVFIQYLPKKPTKWGMKAYVLADSSTGYVWAWMLYTGKDNSLDVTGRNHTHAVVMALVEKLQGRGHHSLHGQRLFQSGPLRRTEGEGIWSMWDCAGESTRFATRIEEESGKGGCLFGGPWTKAWWHSNGPINAKFRCCPPCTTTR